MRNLNVLINKLINYIPHEGDTLINKLMHIQKGSAYTAPEDMIRWDLVEEALYEEIPHPTKDWEFDVLCEWTQRSKEELQQMLNS